MQQCFQGLENLRKVNWLILNLKLYLKHTISEETLHSPHDEGYRFTDQIIINKMTGSEKELKTKKISRRARGRNIVQTVHSDCDDELQSVASDNPHLYTRSRSSVRYFQFLTLFNNIIIRTPLTTPALRSTCSNPEERDL